MGEQELREKIKFLKEKIRVETNQKEKEQYESILEAFELKLSELERKNNTKAQSIGGGIGRLTGSIVSMVAGEFDSIITGTDIKKSRAKYADAGEKAGKAIFGTIGKIIKDVRSK